MILSFIWLKFMAVFAQDIGLPVCSIAKVGSVVAHCKTIRLGGDRSSNPTVTMHSPCADCKCILSGMLLTPPPS